MVVTTEAARDEAIERALNVPPAGIAVEAVAQVLFKANGFAGSSKSPKTSSTNEVSVRASAAEASTAISNVTISPGSVTALADGVSVTEMFGNASSNVTVAVSSDITVFASSS